MLTSRATTREQLDSLMRWKTRLAESRKESESDPHPFPSRLRVNTLAQPHPKM